MLFVDVTIKHNACFARVWWTFSGLSIYICSLQFLIFLTLTTFCMIDFALLVPVSVSLLSFLNYWLCFLVSVRALVFGAMWIILGKRVWFFPNILAEEATLKELFQFWPKKDEGERPKWTARLFYSVLAVSVILLLKHHAPDEAARARLVSLTQRYFTGMEIELSIWVL